METRSPANLSGFFCFLLLFTSAPVFLADAFSPVQLNRNIKIRPINVSPKTIEYLQEVDLGDYDLGDIIPPGRQEFIPESHPCQRVCEEGKPMTCRYEFTVEYYYTMSKACYNCPYNISDCYLNECIAGDGMERTLLVVNKRLPGPSIDVCYGDTIEVELKNKMFDVSTTIHWHGIYQKETPFMDGVPFVSQCLVSPQSTFLYRFFADNPGTHLWHSHSALQRGDGIFGPLIIRVPPSQEKHLALYDYDLPEHVVTILDWSHKLSVNKFTAHYHSKGDNKPASILVNGRGRFKEFTRGDEVFFTPAEKFTVAAGNRYRFRVINAGFLNCPVEISIDNHNITVIASDGGDLEPVETHTLVTAAGERFDFVLEANQEIGNYWMRFTGLLDCKVKKAFQVAILHYEGAGDEEPEGEATYDSSLSKEFKVNAINTAPGTDDALIMSELSSLPTDEDDPALKPEADVKFYLAFDFYPVENSHFRYPVYGDDFNSALFKVRSRTPQINRISMQFPNFPLMANLTRADSMEFCNVSSVSMDCRFQFCECPHVLEVPLNAVVELILIDEGVPYEANHPFHLHGYTFKLIGMDRLGNSTSEEEVRRLDQMGMLNRNFVNPPVKDTVSVPDGGYAIVRFHATNPGFWILHCHLDFHVELGMALLFKVGEDSDFVPPPANLPLCGDAFMPTPVNQTRSFTARVHPTQGTLNGTDWYRPSGSSRSDTGRFVWLLLLLLLFLHLPLL